MPKAIVIVAGPCTRTAPRASSGRSTRSTAAAVRKAHQRFKRPLPGGYSPAEDGPSRAVSAGEWMHSRFRGVARTSGTSGERQPAGLGYCQRSTSRPPHHEDRAVSKWFPTGPRTTLAEPVRTRIPHHLGVPPEPSVGLEPTTPSLPWNDRVGTDGHEWARVGKLFLQWCEFRVTRSCRPSPSCPIVGCARVTPGCTARLLPRCRW